MGVESVTSIDPSVAELFADTASRTPSKLLDQDDFLQLLVAQMTTQDPMNPVANTEFIAQMAQFTALEQSRTMTNTITAMSRQQEVLQANAFIGREVTLVDDEQNVIRGVVTGMEIEEGSPLILVGGQRYGLSAVASVTLPVAVATTDPVAPSDPKPTPETEVPVLPETSNL